MPLYTVNQLMKMEAYQVTKFACKKSPRINVQSSEPESLMKKDAHILFRENTDKKRVRCNLLITRELFHIQMVLVLCLDDGCGQLILLASWAVAALWRPWSHLLYQIMLSDWSLCSAKDKMTTPTIPIKDHSAAHWSPTKQGSPVIR